MLYLLILSLLAPLEPISWSELKIRLADESVDPDTTHVEIVVDETEDDETD